MGLLKEKILKSGSYLTQGSKRQKAFLNDLATAFGSKWMTPTQMREIGRVVSGSTESSGKRLVDVVVVRAPQFWCTRAARRLPDCAPTARQAPTNCTQRTAHQLPPACLAGERVRAACAASRCGGAAGEWNRWRYRQTDDGCNDTRK